MTRVLLPIVDHLLSKSELSDEMLGWFSGIDSFKVVDDLLVGKTKLFYMHPLDNREDFVIELKMF